MNRIAHIARREWLEQVRQPIMLLVIGSLYVLVAAIVISALGILDTIATTETALVNLGNVLGTSATEAALATMTGVVVTVYNFLVFTQFLGISAVLAGHSVLHDRQVGTLTFLLLAPVHRFELLLGKVIGAIGPAMVLYILVNGVGSAVASALAVTRPHWVYLPLNPAWWVAFLLGGPLSALFVGLVCTTVSSLSHDVRTAQQGVWFVVFFATLVLGSLLTNGLASGVAAELAFAGVVGVASLGALLVGSAVITRDVSR